MDVIISAIGEFIWASSCAVVNFCLISGVSALLVFVSFLCGILALAFYKYTTSREHMSREDATSSLVNDVDTDVYWSNTDSIHPLSEIDIRVNQNSYENEENNAQVFNNISFDTIDDSEEEMQEEQIANIYRLLNDQNLSNNWIDQLKMYGLQTDDEIEFELS